MKTVVLNADDLGICPETNTAILRAFRDRILTSASVMPTMPAFPDALERVIAPNPTLGVGLHLSLTGGIALTSPDEIPLLVDDNQVFCHGFGGIVRLLYGRSRHVAIEQIERELDAHFAAIEAAGVASDHVDSHQYVHMIPEVWALVLRLAQRHRCPAIRLADEKLRLRARSLTGLLRAFGRFNLAKKLLLSRWSARNRRLLEATQKQSHPIRCADHFVGVLDSGRMDAATLRRVFQSLPPGVTEIVTHPGLGAIVTHPGLGAIVTHPGLGAMTVDQRQSPRSTAPNVIARADRQFLQSDHRRGELAALLDDELRHVIDRSDVQLARFRDCLVEPCEAAS